MTNRTVRRSGKLNFVDNGWKIGSSVDMYSHRIIEV